MQQSGGSLLCTWSIWTYPVGLSLITTGYRHGRSSLVSSRTSPTLSLTLFNSHVDGTMQKTFKATLMKPLDSEVTATPPFRQLIPLSLMPHFSYICRLGLLFHQESLAECSISYNNDLRFVCELFWVNLRWLVLVKYSQVLVKSIFIFKSTWVQVLFEADEYCKIGTRVPKYRSTEYFGPKPVYTMVLKPYNRVFYRAILIIDSDGFQVASLDLILDSQTEGTVLGTGMKYNISYIINPQKVA